MGRGRSARRSPSGRSGCAPSDLPASVSASGPSCRRCASPRAVPPVRRRPRPSSAVAPEGPVGEVYRSAAASIAHDWDDYLFMGHTGHSAVPAAAAFAADPERGAPRPGRRQRGRRPARRGALPRPPQRPVLGLDPLRLGRRRRGGRARPRRAGAPRTPWRSRSTSRPYGMWPGLHGAEEQAAHRRRAGGGRARAPRCSPPRG